MPRRSRFRPTRHGQARDEAAVVALWRSAAPLAVDQSRSDTVTGIIGARRAWTVSMMSPAVDALQADGRDAEVAVSELTLDDDQRDTPSRAISTAGACRSSCGAKRRRTRAVAA